ncbi:MAG: beta-ketoacyl synthase N-terminal-like domain-containing protein, partial [Terrimicrobiaceae bacterium]
MSERRVVVTGIGVVSPVGNDLQTFWKSVVEGRSGIRKFEAFDSTNFDCKIAGEVRDFEAAKYFKNPKTVKRTDRFTQFAMAGTKMALEDSGIDLEKIDRTRFGVMIGSGIGGLYSMEE